MLASLYCVAVCGSQVSRSSFTADPNTVDCQLLHDEVTHTVEEVRFLLKQSWGRNYKYIQRHLGCRVVEFGAKPQLHRHNQSFDRNCSYKVSTPMLSVPNADGQHTHNDRKK